MAYNNDVITNNWNNVQQRSVDPYANVDSDIANNLHIIYSDKNAYFTGLGIKGYDIGTVNNNTAMIIRLYPGTVMMNNVSIKFKGEAFSEANENNESTYEMRIPLFLFNDDMNIYVTITKIVVVEYTYDKVSPAPVAQIKTITSVDYDSSKHLKLYTFNINGPCVYSDTYLSNVWNVNNGLYTITDERYKTGVIFRTGDTMTGHLRIIKEPNSYSGSDYYAVNKKYVEQRLADMGLDNAVLKSGNIPNYINIPIMYNENQISPSINELITKKYADNTYIAKNNNSTLTGKITLSGTSADIIVPDTPKTNSSVVNKKYVSNVLGNMNSSAFVNKSGDTLSGVISLDNSVSRLSLSSDKHKLISKAYADTLYLKNTGTSQNETITGALKVSTTSYIIDNDSGNFSTLVTKKYCDENYVSTSASNMTFTTIPKLSPSLSVSVGTDDYNLVTKKYCDDTYLKATFTNSNSNDSSGSLTLTNGFILKWGKVSTTQTFANDVWADVSFGTGNKFPTYCFNVIVTWVYNSGSTEKDISICIKDITDSGFKINLGPYLSSTHSLSNETLTFYYQAIGK